MTRARLASILLVVTAGLGVALASCRGGLGGQGEATGEVTADAGSGSGSDWIQPTCVDTRLADHPGSDDGASCTGTDTSTTCTIVSQCPNYCVHCSDGSSTCTPCR
jgi:hypothetical protein